MHLGGNHEFSTFRRTIGSILAVGSSRSDIDENALSAWMESHLRVLAVPYADGDTLGALEAEVLQAIDPPLNLQGMPTTSIRVKLRELRGRNGARGD